MKDAISWATAYETLIADLRRHVGQARLLIGGFNTCFDIYLSLRDVEAVRDAAVGTPAAAVFAELARRAVAGVGGELAVDWPEGPAWMDRHLTGIRAIGGTNAQAAQQWAVLGAKALISIEDRSEGQLAPIHPDVLVAKGDELLPKRDIVPNGKPSKAPHYVFEYKVGDRVAGQLVTRSSRTIVRFADTPLEHDADFDRITMTLASEAGAGIICGFNEIATENFDEELGYAASVARGWREHGLSLVHFELGDYKDPSLRDRSLNVVAPAVSSLGLSLSESKGLRFADEGPEAFAIRLAEQYDLARVCIHADEWAMAVTRGDPSIELDALMMGCLLAASRAAAGHVVLPERLPADARFAPPPFPVCQRRGDWSVVCCPSPYLEAPAATIGLGDTFVSGTLLVLGAVPSGKALPAGHLPPPRILEDQKGI